MNTYSSHANCNGTDKYIMNTEHMLNHQLFNYITQLFVLSASLALLGVSLTHGLQITTYVLMHLCTYAGVPPSNGNVNSP